MPDWGEIFAAPEMQELRPNPEFLAVLPDAKAGGCRRVLDVGCGAGRHLLPLALEGFEVWGVDREAAALQVLKEKIGKAGIQAHLAVADMSRLPFQAAVFQLVVSIHVINHGYARTFREYCREMDRVLQPGGFLFVYASPRAAGEMARLPETRELEPGTMVNIATPDGNLVHHFPEPEEIAGQFPGYQVRRGETILAPIPFMGGKELPQYVFWARKAGQYSDQ